MTSDQDLSAPASKSKARLSFDRSRAEIERNRETLAGGVSSNFRLNISPTPLVFESGDGSYLTDIDGNRLIDYYLGMGPMILEGTGLASDLLWDCMSWLHRCQNAILANREAGPRAVHSCCFRS